jgi:hypothetical protein
MALYFLKGITYQTKVAVVTGGFGLGLKMYHIKINILNIKISPTGKGRNLIKLHSNEWTISEARTQKRG